MLISAAMIVKNESRCIIRCLSSIIDAVDEIVIVDTGSTDNTIELIEEFRKNRKNIKLYHFDWIDDFATARNFSLSKTRGEWKFVIDADEFLHPNDVLKVRACCKNASLTGILNVVADVELININDFEIEDIYTTGIIRIFKGGFKYKGLVHEALSESISNQKMERINMPIRLLHDGYDSTVVNRRGKSLRNIRILEECLKKEPENYIYYLYFAREIRGLNPQMAFNYIEEAARLYEKNGIEDKIMGNHIKDTREKIIEQL
ncbi:glycosyltransferase family 2 protein [Paenibacillus sp. 19GGS1-52]|uniref:glycosyltransferase family 2 protein n=1 Tax=Paenibacillus sp. 19GGS1-52 TaxID=2758563 RepID=UPI001EFA41A0|nr:glycosyltransferase family 2 protein [Paenibacillus sp. 19GGS1-52]ULO09471.1 glycosyltransferase family 2 protein [Paenibacillus sp. 19GGS1-52]